jgi:hypothetical protein
MQKAKLLYQLVRALVPFLLLQSTATCTIRRLLGFNAFEKRSTHHFTRPNRIAVLKDTALDSVRIQQSNEAVIIYSSYLQAIERAYSYDHAFGN